MSDNPSKEILSIVIPLYKGKEFLAETLESIISQWDEEKVEIVMCDDVSTDGTFEVAKKYSELYKNIKLFRNEVNLGMDGNFEKVVNLATGEYIWFCGQDDIFGKGAIEKVLNVIQKGNTIDFMYVNYSQNNHDLSKVITEKMLPIDNDVLCKDSKSFLAITDIEKLPTFLPSYVLRKSLWDKIDKKPFYGTQYIQIGVLLSLLPDLTTYIIAYPHIKGRIPDNGWQQSNLKLIDVCTGFLEVITYIHRTFPEVFPEEMYRRNYQFYMKIILNIMLQLRLEGRTLNEKIERRIKYLFNLRQILFVKLLFMFPHKIIITSYILAKKILIIYRKIVPIKVMKTIVNNQLWN